MTGKNKQVSDLLEDASFREMVLTGKDVKIWQEWIKKHPDQQATFDLAVRVLEEINQDTQPWEASNKAALLYKINRNRTIGPVGSIYNPKVILPGLVLVVGMVVGIWGYMGSWKTPDSGFAEQQPLELAWTVKSNPAGQKSKIILPDGSNVTLNSASEISYSTEFAKKNREIHLKGEAFFEVVSDSLLVFEVYAGSLVTQALGTSFNIKNYPDIPQRVQLTTGSVRVSQENYLQNPILLNPGQEAVLTQNKNLQTQSFDIGKATAWKEGILYFNKASFEEVVTTLERWYGVSIHIENVPHKSFDVTAEFKKDYLENVLHSLGFTFNFNYAIDNKKVTIRFRPKSL